MRGIKAIMNRLEKAYQEGKNEECRELHNAIAAVIAEQKATVQNVLYVVKLIEFEILRAKYQQLLGNAIVPPGGGVKQEAEKV